MSNGGSIPLGNLGRRCWVRPRVSLWEGKAIGYHPPTCSSAVGRGVHPGGLTPNTSSLPRLRPCFRDEEHSSGKGSWSARA